MDLVVVTIAPDIVAATAIKAMLEQAGIPAMLRGSGSLNWLIPGTPGGVGPLDVLVAGERAAEAEELIAGLESGEAWDGDTSAVEDVDAEDRGADEAAADEAVAGRGDDGAEG